MFCQVLFYHIPPALKSAHESRSPPPGRSARQEAVSVSAFSSIQRYALLSVRQSVYCTASGRAGLASSQSTRTGFANGTLPLRAANCRPAAVIRDDAAILYSQHFQLCRAAVGTAGSIAGHLVCCHPLSGFQRAGRPRVHPQVYQHVHFPRAPPGEQRFHRLLGTAAAPEEHHGALSPRDDHGRSVPAPGQLHPDDLPVQDVPQTNGQRRRQHQTGQCHPRPDTPVVRQPPQPQQQQADEGGAGSVKIDLCPGPAGYPEGPSGSSTLPAWPRTGSTPGAAGPARASSQTEP